MAAAPEGARERGTVVARDADAADVRLPPPLAFGAALVVGIVLQLYVLRLELPLPPVVAVAAAVVTGGAAIALLASALVAFRRTGQDPKPWKTTPEFIVTGVYRWTRNPMYTGMALVQTSLACALANGWLLALVPAVLLVVHVTAVRPEEAYLEQKFGASYREFKQTVRRWL